uniref:Uncharacterized protein n=1 Tax=Guillardia theta TaxID=55529 RepID=A0A7S4PRD2_GUITH|mmetsp:Transcript_8477/g.28423  ORF Transcript_8477/g.28423 Transcript_8477/m.28423 type:complete len:323 (+) Transcript_8477:154-1122(+)
MFVNSASCWRPFRPILNEGNPLHPCAKNYEVTQLARLRLDHRIPTMKPLCSHPFGMLAETERLGMIRAVGNEVIFAALLFCFSMFVKRIYTSIEIAAKFKDPNLSAPLQTFSETWNVFAGLVLFWAPLFLLLKAIGGFSPQNSISHMLTFGPYLISFATQGFIQSGLGKSFHFPVSSQSLLSLSTIIVSIPFQVWRLYHLHFCDISLLKSLEGQMMYFISFMKVVTVVHMALYLLRLPWISSKANPFVSGSDLYKRYESLQEEVKALREQNRLLKELYGVNDIQQGGVLRVQRLAELQNAYVTKRTKSVEARKGKKDLEDED